MLFVTENVGGGSYVACVAIQENRLSIFTIKFFKFLRKRSYAKEYVLSNKFANFKCVEGKVGPFY